MEGLIMSNQADKSEQNEKFVGSGQTGKVVQYIANEYGVEREYLWTERFPTYAVFRNPENQKWFGIIMTIPGIHLGLETEI